MTTTQLTEKLLDEANVTWTYVDAAPLETINFEISQSNQVRDIPVDRGLVDQYSEAMKTGATFPPIIIAETPEVTWILGGNHRALAAIDAESPIGAYVVSNPTEQQSRRISFGDNTTNGKPPTKKEKRRHLVWMVDVYDLPISHAAKVVGLTDSQAQTTIRVYRAKERAASTGVSYPARNYFRESAWSNVASVKSDLIFARIIEECFTWAFTTKQTEQLISKVQAAPTEAQQMAVIQSAVDLARLSTRDRDQTTARIQKTEADKLLEVLSDLDGIRLHGVVEHARGTDIDLWESKLKSAAKSLMKVSVALRESQ